MPTNLAGFCPKTRVCLVRGTGRDGTGQGVPSHVWYAKNGWNALFHGTEIWCFCVPPPPPRGNGLFHVCGTHKFHCLPSLLTFWGVRGGSSSSSSHLFSLPLSFPVAIPSSSPVAAASPGSISIFSLSSCISKFDLNLLQESLHLPDFSYEKVSWQPKDCQMEEFEGYKFLKSFSVLLLLTNALCFSFYRSPCMLLQHISSVGIVGIS
ncbi:unnamed protein product [Malus baccata var. baccata]